VKASNIMIRPTAARKTANEAPSTGLERRHWKRRQIPIGSGAAAWLASEYAGSASLSPGGATTLALVMLLRGSLLFFTRMEAVSARFSSVEHHASIVRHGKLKFPQPSDATGREGEAPPNLECSALWIRLSVLQLFGRTSGSNPRLAGTAVRAQKIAPPFEPQIVGDFVHGLLLPLKRSIRGHPGN
jgi:hypothetical protein